MSPDDQRRVFRDLSCCLARGDEITEDQRSYLSLIFYRISEGEDANHVLQLKLNRGQKQTDLVARKRLSLILHWIACAQRPDLTSETKVLSVEEACVKALEAIVPQAKRFFPGVDDQQYDADYLMRCWSAPEYKHMRSLRRSPFDPDFPY